ncbi:hypothetical protein Tco_0464709 [Tanacetum coccineum]
MIRNIISYTDYTINSSMATMAENVIAAGAKNHPSMREEGMNLHTVNFDQLYTFLKYNEKDAKEVREMQQRFSDSLALLANTYNPPPSYNSKRFQYHSPAPEVYQPYQSYQPTTLVTQQSIQPLLQQSYVSQVVPQ